MERLTSESLKFQHRKQNRIENHKTKKQNEIPSIQLIQNKSITQTDRANCKPTNGISEMITAEVERKTNVRDHRKNNL